MNYVPRTIEDGKRDLHFTDPFIVGNLSDNILHKVVIQNECEESQSNKDTQLHLRSLLCRHDIAVCAQ